MALNGKLVPHYKPQRTLSESSKQITKLQRKIAPAYRNDDMKRVFEFQRILVNSVDARALAVYRVLSSKGGKTPGIDNYVPQSTEKINKMIEKLAIVTKSPKNYKPSSVLRVWIPKGYSTDEKRPLGIPTIFDRAVQSLYMMALLPIAELTADQGSFGYREGLGTLDAVHQLKVDLLKLPQPILALDADIKTFFDNVDHEWLLKNIPIDKVILEKILPIYGGNPPKGRFLRQEL